MSKGERCCSITEQSRRFKVSYESYFKSTKSEIHQSSQHIALVPATAASRITILGSPNFTFLHKLVFQNKFLWCNRYLSFSIYITQYQRAQNVIDTESFPREPHKSRCALYASSFQRFPLRKWQLQFRFTSVAAKCVTVL